jgi:hypothetical protein
VRQTLLFSATMPAEVLRLTEEFLRDPKLVQSDAAAVPPRRFPRRADGAANEKTSWLARWLREEATGPVWSSAAPRSAPTVWRPA